MIALSASTLGAPGERLDTVLGWLAASHVTGIELRLAEGELAHPGMSVAARRDLAARLAGAGVAVTCIASYVTVADDAPDDLVVEGLTSALRLAADLGSPAVRVFPGAPMRIVDGVPTLREPEEVADARAARRLNAVASLAGDLGVYPCLETHDSHPRGADARRILERVDGPVGAIWDLLHPYRSGEPLEHTWALLEPWLSCGRGGVQLKDASLGDLTPRPIGEGELPVDRFATLLRANDYDGTITLEWERAWHPEIAALDVALASAERWFDRHWPR